MYWAYSPRAQKELLPYSLPHSKVVKRGIANLCLESALRKSRVHDMQGSFWQDDATGYPGSVEVTVVGWLEWAGVNTGGAFLQVSVAPLRTNDTRGNVALPPTAR